ncbi:MAG: transglycosylase domain-containing protein, partial [Planktomarina sp.]
MRRARLATMLTFVALAGAWVTFDQWVKRTDLPDFKVEFGTEVLDRNQKLLRAYLTSDGKWRLAVTADSVDDAYLRMLIRYEDKRFYSHPGVDVIALVRSAILAARRGQVTSGGSTLTMQVAR